MYKKFGQFIDGNWSPSSNKETYEVINPATEEVLGHASKATPADVDRALKSAEKGLKISRPFIILASSDFKLCGLKKNIKKRASKKLYFFISPL